MSKTVFLKSHVGRDVIQSAQTFSSVPAAIWEYVINSIQYVDQSIKPIVHIEIEKKGKGIQISDNGRGMDKSDLQEFFTMHGENMDRRQNRPGRGKFGTGKSAAFGIGKKLIVDTVKNKKRNVVQLTQQQLDTAVEKIPLTFQINDQPTEDRNGTKIIIEDIFKKVSTSELRKYIERQLKSCRAIKPIVLVEDHECRYSEPTYTEKKVFYPDSEQAKIIGDTELHIKISQTPLQADERGVDVLVSEGNLVAIETLGMEQKDMGQYLFGEIMCPALEDEKYDFDAFDMTRNQQLKRDHPVSQVLLPFIGTCLEEVRMELAKKKLEKKKTEQNKLLEQAQKDLSDFLNTDIDEFQDRLESLKKTTARKNKTDHDSTSLTAGEDARVEGMDERGTLEENPETNIRDYFDPDPNPNPNPNPYPDNNTRFGKEDKHGDAAVDKASKKRKKRKPNGGFNIEFKNMGPDEHRSKFIVDQSTIFINLDAYPLSSVKFELEDPNPLFLKLAREIAFTEYAFAIANNLLDKDPGMDAQDIIYEISTTIYRLSGNSKVL